MIGRVIVDDLVHVDVKVGGCTWTWKWTWKWKMQLTRRPGSRDVRDRETGETRAASPGRKISPCE